MIKKLIVAICFSAVTAFSASQLSIPENGWLVNNFKDKESGATPTFEKAPDGSNAIMVKFYGTKNSNISIDPKAVKEQSKSWPQSFNGLNGYFWNDGKLTKLVFSFKMDTQNQFVGSINMDHNGWKQLRIDNVVNFRDKGMKLQPYKIFGIFFNCSNRQDFKTGFGSLTWEEPGTVLYKEPAGHAVNIMKTGTPPQIDGELNDVAWQVATPAELSNQAIKQDQKLKNKSWFKAVWDENNFYIAASMMFPKDTKLKADMKNHDDPLWENDDFEFMLYPDVNQRQYYQFVVNPAGATADIAVIFDQEADQIIPKYKDWNGKWTAKAKMHSDHWTVEAAVPWKTIGSSGVPQIIQFQALRTDMSVNPTQFAVWSPVIRRPIEGFGFLNPVINNNQINFQDIALKRLEDGRVIVSGAVETEKTPGTVNINVWHNSPYSPPDKFTFPVKYNTTVTPFTLTLSPKYQANGFHQFVMKAISENSDSGCAIYDFNQTLPCKVKFSELLLNPVPKQMKITDGTFMPKRDDVIVIPAGASERTEKTAKYLAEKIYAIYGVKPAISRDGKGRIKIILASKEKLQTDSDSAEAYKLKIEPENIIISANGEAGLYYGVITLAQIAASAKSPNAPIKCVDITDWPAFSNRIVCMYEMGHCKKASNGRGYDMEQLKDWLQRDVAGNKLNLLGLGFADNVNYPSLKKLHHPNNFSPEDIRELCDFAREHFIEIMPSVLFGAHSIFWTRHYPEIVESQFGPHQIDVSNPQVYELMEKLFTDISNMCGKPIRYFNTMNDEWWHGKRTAENNMLNNKNRQYWFEKFLLAEYGIIKKLGLQMVMFDDMLLEMHNGGAPFNLHKVAEQLPRDIVMMSWSDSNEPLYKLGFKQCWKVENGFSADFRKPFTQDSGFGTITYLFADTMFNHISETKWLNFSFQTQMQTANYAWNREAGGVLPMQEWTYQNMGNLMGTYSIKSAPAAGNKLTPLTIPRNEKIIDEFKIPQPIEVGEIPMTTGVVEILPGKTFKTNFPSDTFISTLYILNNISIKNKTKTDELRKLFQKYQPYGIIVGNYIINYSDGTKYEKPIRLGRDISLVQFTNPQCRYIKNSRAVYPLTEDQQIALNQFELINPYPDKAVTSFEIISTIESAPILLCAITARNTKKTGINIK